MENKPVSGLNLTSCICGKVQGVVKGVTYLGSVWGSETG